MFSLVTISQENGQINPDCGFKGQRMFVWIPLKGQTVAGVCACMCIHMCVCVVFLSVCAEETRGKREGGGESLEFCFQQYSVPEACRIQFAVVTTSKLCRKIATVSGKPHFPARHSYR